jgi:glycosyltransferase involved in cell wall biosynthesis
MKDLISIVIPVYNTAKYLPRCIESIINQTYKNLEIIIVDDSSTDDSGKIADEYSKKDSRIIIIHQENRGISIARNKAIEVATGDFIGFVDSDDYIEIDMYELLLNTIKEYNADIVQCSYYRVGQDNKILPKNYSGQIEQFDTISALEELIKNKKDGYLLDSGAYHI